jgi:hypothetical protein
MPIVIDVPNGPPNTIRTAIEQAVQTARQTPGEVNIRVAAGVHRIDEPIVISNLGVDGARITISGAGRGRTVITGGRPASPEGLDKVPADLRAGIPKACSARARLVRLSDREQALFNGFLPRRPGGGQKASLPVVSQGGGQLHPARWPAEGYQQGVVGEGRSLKVGAGANLKEGEFLWAGGFWSRDYFYEQNRIRFSAASGGVSVEGVDLKPGGESRFVVFNALSSLVRPGTYVYRPELKALLVCPLSGGEISVAATPELLRVEATQGLKIQNVEFSGASGVGISFRNASDVVVDKVSVRNISGTGIVIAGGKDVAVRESLVEEIGGAGISVSGGDRKSLVASGHKIVGNTIRNFAQIDHSYRPGINLFGVGNVVRGNTISQAPHSAIIFSGNDHDISDNRISDVNRDGGDAGAIYTGRDWTARGTVIANNTLSHIGNGRDSVRGIYLDDLASGIVVSGNRFFRVSNPILVGGGRDNLISGNRFLEANGVAILLDERGRTWYRRAANDPKGELRTRLTSVPFEGAAYRERYKNISNILSDDPEAPKYNRIVGNCAWGPVRVDLFKTYKNDNEVQPVSPCTVREADGKQTGD